MEIKNIIFHLGGVILDLDVPKTLVGFSELAGMTPQEVTRIFKESDGFLRYERGEYSDQEFRDFVRRVYNVSATDNEIDRCWTAMLGGIPPAKLDLLTRLKSRYQTFLLSNTNNIHLDFMNNEVLPKSNIPELETFFHKTYYSHLMRKRKPDAEIFLQVLEENDLNPSETLFLDDNADNVAGGAAVGLRTAYVDTPNFILDYFHD
jgi:glucose-1-phosphatase